MELIVGIVIIAIIFSLCKKIGYFIFRRIYGAIGVAATIALAYFWGLEVAGKFLIFYVLLMLLVKYMENRNQAELKNQYDDQQAIISDKKKEIEKSEDIGKGLEDLFDFEKEK